MNYQEILEKMEEMNITKGIFSGDERHLYDAEYEDSLDFQKKDFVVEGLGRIVTVLEEGGSNDLQDGAYGCDWKIVRHFVDHDIYIKLEAFYSSYEGAEVDDEDVQFEQVIPRQKMITVYDSI